VHSNKKISNQSKSISLKNKAYNKNQFNINTMKTETKEYWEQLAEEIVKLNGILMRIKGYAYSVKL